MSKPEDKKVLIINNAALDYKDIRKHLEPSIALLYDQGMFTTADEIMENTFDIVNNHAMVVVDDWDSSKNRDWNALINKLRTNPNRDNYYCTVVILTKQHLSKTLVRSPFVKIINKF